MKKTVAGEKRTRRRQWQERRGHEEDNGWREEDVKKTVAGEKRI